MSYSDPTNIEDAIYQRLFRDTPLYNMVSGKMFTSLDLKDLSSKLGSSATAALISVSYFDDTLEPMHGSASHHLCAGSGLLQVDIAARGGKRDATKIASKVRSLIYNDINITIAGKNYDLTITKPRIVLSYNDTAAVWVAAVRASVEYDTEGE